MVLAMKKSFWIVLIITMLVVSSNSKFSFVHGRVLRSEASLNTQVGNGCEDYKGADSSHLGMATFAVSSNSFTTRHPERSLAYKLHSGPSEKGPGH